MTSALYAVLLLVACCPAARYSQQERVSYELARTEATLRATLTDGPAEMLAARTQTLDSLQRYARAGVFPKTNTTVLAPCFVDRDGRRCAVAFLLEEKGHVALVKRIAETSNALPLGSLADDAELVAAIDQLGLSFDEAAAIDPGYAREVPTPPVPQRAMRECGGVRPDPRPEPLGVVVRLGALGGSLALAFFVTNRLRQVI